MTPRLLLSVVFAAIVAAAAPARAELRALVVGVDKYAAKQELRGSVNDATDIANVLKGDGVTDLAVLTDGAATRAAFAAAWSGIVARVRPGDVVFLSFSGHGVRVPDAPGKAPTEYGSQKGFLLQPYDEKAAPSEILRDEDLYDLFGEASAKGGKVIFIADACHAGAAVRGIDGRAGGTFRFQRFQTQAVVAPAPVAPAEPAKARPPNPAVTVLSATDERLTIQEIVVDGQYRGALSYAVARGLEGAAGDTAGTVTPAALRRFVSPLVRVLSGNRQIPQFAVPAGDLPLLAVRPGEAAPGVLGTVGVALIGELPADLQLTGAKVTADKSLAEITYDVASRQLVSAEGDVLASNLSPAKLQGAIDGRRVLNALRGMMAHQFGPVTTRATVVNGAAGADNGFFVDGMTARFESDPGDFNFITVLDLTATGAVQFMWPITDLGDPVEWTASQPLSFTAPVRPPFGADYIVTLLSREPLGDLHRVLARVHNSVAPVEFYDALRAARATTEIRVGIEGVFSCQSLRSNGQCDSMQPSSP